VADIGEVAAAVRERGGGPLSATKVHLPGRAVSDDMHCHQITSAGERLGHLLRRRAAGLEQHRIDAGPQLCEDSLNIAYGRINEEDFRLRRHDESPRDS
jgi:hypothetical protein